MPSFEQNEKNKKWSVRFRAIEDGVEKNKRLSGFKTKKEANLAYLEFQSENNKKIKKEASKNEPQEMLFSVLIDGFLQNQKTRVKESSYLSNKSKINIHIAPFFGEKKIKEITPLVVLEWQQNIIGDYSYTHKANLRTLLSSIYKFGERYYDIQNVMVKVEPFRNTEPPKEMEYWTREEFDKFLACCNDEDMKVLFKFLYITGCRKGECQAVTWRDIDFKNATVRISKNITRKTTEGTYKVVSPKNVSSNRTIDLPKTFCEELKKYKGKNLDEFVFGGAHPVPDRRIERVMKNSAREAGIKIIRVHDLRHSCASLLISQGISIVAVSKRLGHKNIEQTLNTYAHLMPQEANRIVEILENI